MPTLVQCITIVTFAFGPMPEHIVKIKIENSLPTKFSVFLVFFFGWCEMIFNEMYQLLGDWSIILIFEWNKKKIVWLSKGGKGKSEEKSWKSRVLSNPFIFFSRRSFFSSYSLEYLLLNSFKVLWKDGTFWDLE